MAVAISFALVAFIYSLVGFGGGSSYIAILSLAGVDFKVIPVIALCCNLIVVAGGSWQFARSRYFDQRFIVPFVVTSVPMAFIGGRMPISERAFTMLLGGALLLAGLKLLIADRLISADYEIRTPRRDVCLGVGAALGLLSGMVGIGGGIFLSPLLMLLRWADPKKTAATASVFILLNSLSGLMGQIAKGIETSALVPYAGLFVAVFAGGQIGSRISVSTWISSRRVMDVTAILTLLVAAKTLVG